MDLPKRVYLLNTREGKMFLLLLMLISAWVILIFVPDDGALPDNEAKKKDTGISNQLAIVTGLTENKKNTGLEKIIDIFSSRIQKKQTVVIPKEPIKPPEPVAVVIPPPAPPVPETPAPKRSELLSKLKYLGFVEKKTGGLFFLSSGDTMLIAKEGDTLENEVYLKKTTDHSIIIQDLNTREEVTLEISR